MKIRAMLREIGELESIGDSFFNLARILRRGRENKMLFTDDQKKGARVLYDLLEEALDQMNAVLSGRREDFKLADSEQIEVRINTVRDELRAQNIEDIDRHTYGYDNGTVFNDFINECERVGDYVMNVVEARFEEPYQA